MGVARFDPEIDRKRARLDEAARATLLADGRRLVIVGASGWIGRTAISLFREALGPQAFDQRVVCFGSRPGHVDLEDGESVAQRPLSALADLAPTPTLLLHLAFLTKDKVAGMDPEAYASANRALSSVIAASLDPIGVDRLFVASSGAAAFADDPAAATDLRLYGALKRDDERLFAGWASAAPDDRRAVIARIYSVSGPWINKPDVYALASFILDGLAGRAVEVRAPMRVWRGYVALRELLSLVLAALLEEDGPPVLSFDSGGEAMELGEVGARVAAVLGADMIRRPVSRPDENCYVGDDASYTALLGRYGVSRVGLDDQVAETAAYMARSMIASMGAGD